MYESKIKTLSDIVLHCTDEGENETAFHFREGKGKSEKITSVTFNRFKRDVYALCSFITENKLQGSQIALIGENSIEWVEAYFAIVSTGSVVVPIDKELPADDVENLIIRSKSKAVFFSKGYRKKVDPFKEKHPDILFTETEKFKEIIQFYNGSEAPDFGVTPDTPAAIVYTSGTTGESKGVLLSHGNLASDATSALDSFNISDSVIAILPLHHTFGLVATILCPLIAHVKCFICKSLRKIKDDILQSKPDVIIVVPMIAETLLKSLKQNIENQGKAKKFKKAVTLSSFLLKFKIDLRRKLFSDIHSAFGGNLRSIIAGGAPVSKELQNELYSIGIDVYNGYGITECSPIVSVSFQKKNKIGTSGTPLTCNKVRIVNPDEDGNGEIEVCGSNVMTGYFEDEEQTKEAFHDGWFVTGDIGKLDKDGFLIITGRSKNLIILSNGKNISPEKIEEKLLRYDNVEEVIVFAENDKLCAEIFPGKDFDFSREEDILSIVKEFNKTVPTYENIEKIVVRKEEFEKTTTMKIKRKYR